MSDVPPQEVPVNRAHEESEVEYSLALCISMGLGQWAALANNAASWRTRTAFSSIIVNSEHGSWLGTERGKRICAKYCGMNTADWLAAVRKLREEVLKKYKYDTPAWNTKFSSNFLNVAEMSAKDLDEAQRVWARSSSAGPPFNALGVGHAMPECLSNPMVCHSVGSARRLGHIPTPSHSWTSTCILQHQEVWLFSSS